MVSLKSEQNTLPRKNPPFVLKKHNFESENTNNRVENIFVFYRVIETEFLITLKVKTFFYL